MATNGTSARKRGRPSLPPQEGKRFALNMRTTREMREKLESAAQASGRSLAQETEFRLERSFQEEDAFGGAELHALFRMLAGTAGLIEAQTGKSWLSDWETAYALTTAWDIVLKAWLPQVPDSFLGDDFLLPPVPQLLPEVRHVPLPPDIDPRLYEMLVARYGPPGFSIMESPAAYEKRMADFEVEIETSKKELAENPNVLDKYKKVADEKIKEFEELKQHIETLENLGSESAFVMLPEQSQQD